MVLGPLFSRARREQGARPGSPSPPHSPGEKPKKRQVPGPLPPSPKAPLLCHERKAFRSGGGDDLPRPRRSAPGRPFLSPPPPKAAAMERGKERDQQRGDTYRLLRSYRAALAQQQPPAPRVFATPKGRGHSRRPRPQRDPPTARPPSVLPAGASWLMRLDARGWVVGSIPAMKPRTEETVCRRRFCTRSDLSYSGITPFFFFRGSDPNERMGLYRGKPVCFV